MTSKERMLTALNKKTPDCIPATIHQWQPYHLKYFMNGMTDIEASRFVGIDASINIVKYIEGSMDSPNWRKECKVSKDGDYTVYDWTVTTPRGVLTYQEKENEITTFVTKHLVKNDEDIYLIRDFMPFPKVDRKYFEKTYDELGNDGIIRTFTYGLQPGCWQDVTCYGGTQEMILACFDKPDWVHEFLNILLDKKLAFIEENFRGLKVDLIENGGGSASNTVISPSMHEEFCLPYDTKMHDALHSIGLKVAYHTCGGMTKILDLILQNHCDASETLTPATGGGDITDPSVVYNALHGNVCMIGGLDQFGILTDGTPEMIEKEVFRLFEAFGKGGGYIMSASDHFYITPVENLKAYAKAAKKCLY